MCQREGSKLLMIKGPATSVKLLEVQWSGIGRAIPSEVKRESLTMAHQATVQLELPIMSLVLTETPRKGLSGQKWLHERNSRLRKAQVLQKMQKIWLLALISISPASVASMPLSQPHLFPGTNWWRKKDPELKLKTVCDHGHITVSQEWLWKNRHSHKETFNNQGDRMTNFLSVGQFLSLLDSLLVQWPNEQSGHGGRLRSWMRFQKQELHGVLA